MLPIKEDDKFFSRLLSKESSKANPSFRVYYGGNSVGVPFMWEAKPGTPKQTKQNINNNNNNFSEENHEKNKNYLPPLTPPPSYYLHQPKKLPIRNNKKSLKIFQGLFPKSFMHRRQISSLSLSSSSYTFSCSSSSSMKWSDTLVGRSSDPHRIRTQRWTMSSPGSLFEFMVNGQDEEYEEEVEVESPRSTLCFGALGGGTRKIIRCGL